MSYLGIIASLPGEIKPLVRGWQTVRLPGAAAGDVAWRGKIGQTECIAIAAGMGHQAAARACALAEAFAADHGGLRGLVSLGWVGALSCGVSPGEAYRIAEVVDAKTGQRFKTSFPPDPAIRLKLVTVDHVAQSQEKRELAEQWRTVFVDMEAAEVARIAEQKSLPFFCFKAVSDAQGELLPDFGRYTNAQGKLEMPALLGHLAMRPKYWPAVKRMGKNSKLGAGALAEAMQNFLEPVKSIPGSAG
jgi:adenosylhomocysteine nucleosidase